MNTRNEYMYKHIGKHIDKVKQHTHASAPLALGAPLLTLVEINQNLTSPFTTTCDL
jgi:hypothetical protein